MTNATSNQALAEGIERLVQEHIATTRKSAQEAVERAFAGAVGARSALSGLWPAGQRQSRGTEIMVNFRPCLSLTNSNTLWFSFSRRSLRRCGRL